MKSNRATLSIHQCLRGNNTTYRRYVCTSCSAAAGVVFTVPKRKSSLHRPSQSLNPVPWILANQQCHCPKLTTASSNTQPGKVPQPLQTTHLCNHFDFQVHIPSTKEGRLTLLLSYAVSAPPLQPKHARVRSVHSVCFCAGSRLLSHLLVWNPVIRPSTVQYRPVHRLPSQL